MTSQAIARERTVVYELVANDSLVLFPNSAEISGTSLILGAGIITAVKFTGAAVGNITSARIHDFADVNGLLKSNDYTLTGLTSVTSDSAGDTDCRCVFTPPNEPAPYNGSTWNDNTEEAVVNLQAAFDSDWEGQAHCLRGMALVLTTGTVLGGAVTITFQPRTSGANRLRIQSKHQGVEPLRI